MQTINDWITLSFVFMDFVVGVYMFAIVAWLVRYRMKELKDCWQGNTPIRYYFCLTLIGIVLDLALGVCGIVFVSHESLG